MVSSCQVVRWRSTCPSCRAFWPPFQLPSGLISISFGNAPKASWSTWMLLYTHCCASAQAPCWTGMTGLLGHTLEGKLHSPPSYAYLRSVIRASVILLPAFNPHFQGAETLGSMSDTNPFNSSPIFFDSSLWLIFPISEPG